jgi:hypothetical protein
MEPKLIGNPLIAWRDEQCLQVGWDAHGLVVEDAPEQLPAWLRTLRGDRSRDRAVAAGERMGLERADLEELLVKLDQVGLLAGGGAVRLAVRGEGLVVEELAEVLRRAGVEIDPAADTAVLPLGQLPTFFPGVGLARRLIPVWFEAAAVHVGPVIDHDRGPCPTCIDREWAARDERWPRLVAQASAVPTWHDGVQVLQAAAGITLLAGSRTTVGLEMIFDRASPGPAWRVWRAHDTCDCVAV